MDYSTIDKLQIISNYFKDLRTSAYKISSLNRQDSKRPKIGHHVKDALVLIYR